MKIIIDSNVLLSALIRDSTTRKILVNSNWQFYYPEMSFHEIRKYKELVINKSGMTEEEYSTLLSKLLEYINLIPDEKIIENLNQAKNIMLKIDPDDVAFISACLSVKESVIWSDDSDFEKQDKIKVLKTKEIINIFN